MWAAYSSDNFTHLTHWLLLKQRFRIYVLKRVHLKVCRLDLTTNKGTLHLWSLDTFKVTICPKHLPLLYIPLCSVFTSVGCLHRLITSFACEYCLISWKKELRFAALPLETSTSHISSAEEDTFPVMSVALWAKIVSNERSWASVGEDNNQAHKLNKLCSLIQLGWSLRESLLILISGEQWCWFCLTFWCCSMISSPPSLRPSIHPPIRLPFTPTTASVTPCVPFQGNTVQTDLVTKACDPHWPHLKYHSIAFFPFRTCVCWWGTMTFTYPPLRSDLPTPLQLQTGRRIKRLLPAGATESIL